VLLTHSDHLLKAGRPFPEAFTSGQHWAFWVTVGIAVAALAATLALVRRDELATVEPQSSPGLA
jgi:hypothetical protein